MCWHDEIWFLSNVFHLTDMFLWYKIWVDLYQEYLIQYLKGAESLLQKESGSDSLGAKVAPSLNGVDPSFMNSVAGSYLQSKVLKYLTWYWGSTSLPPTLSINTSPRPILKNDFHGLRKWQVDKTSGWQNDEAPEIKCQLKHDHILINEIKPKWERRGGGQNLPNKLESFMMRKYLFSWNKTVCVNRTLQ
jgi:hypothetical protein